MYCTAQGIQPISYNNYKQNVTFKNCDSLCCTTESYNMVHQLYLNKKRSGKKLKSIPATANFSNPEPILEEMVY